MSLAVPFAGGFIMEARNPTSGPGGELTALAICLAELSSVALIIRGIIGEHVYDRISIAPVFRQKNYGLNLTIKL